MTDVLARIVARKRADVAKRLETPIAAEPTTRSLRAALAQYGARFVMEVKRASPSGHTARHSLGAAVAAYAPVADAISVLTDTPFFGGSLDDLRQVREAFDGPILAKDFIVDPRQVAEARAAGADAVLVMLSVLDNGTAARVMGAARALAMDAIVEVHDESELARAIALDAEIIGINNRDLKTLETDLAVTERLAPLVPSGVLVIAESGIAMHADVERLAGHADAFLVGSALMASDHIAEAARALVHGRVKICGLTNQADVAAAAACGATHAGFVLVPGTPRALTTEQARPLVVEAQRLGMTSVAVFRDFAVDDVVAAVAALPVGAIQLHGGGKQIAAIRAAIPAHIEIWQSATPRDRISTGADRLIFDNGRGGTGQAFDWTGLDGHPALANAFLAGGIGPDNAAAAAAVGAYGLDSGSQTEAAPGIKDRAKLSALFDALRANSRGERCD